MKILATGSACYVGSHTCVVLQEAGYRVVVADDLRNNRASPGRYRRVLRKYFLSREGAGLEGQARCGRYAQGCLAL